MRILTPNTVTVVIIAFVAANVDSNSKAVENTREHELARFKVDLTVRYLCRHPTRVWCGWAAYEACSDFQGRSVSGLRHRDP